MAGAIVLALVGLLGLPATADAQPSPPGSLLVVPFESPRREPRLYWLQEGAAVLLADALSALGVDAINRAERRTAFEQLNLPAQGGLTRATVIKVGLLVGAVEVVEGDFDVVDDQFVVRARAIRLDAGQMRPEAIERGPLTHLFDIFDRLARKIAPPGGLSATAPGAGAASAAHPPLEAFENFVKGLIAETAATQASYLQAAIKQHPTYDRARLALWQVRNEQGEHLPALATALAISAESPAVRRARFYATLSRIHLTEYEQAFSSLTALLKEREAAALYNNLAVIQLRRGWTPVSGRPSFYFTKAVESEPDDPDYYFNLGYAYWVEHDPVSAAHWLREAVRRDPTDGAAHYVLGAALAASGNAVESARERELARQLSSLYDEWERNPPRQLGGDVPRGLERLKTELETPRARRLDAVIVGNVQREQRELAAFHLDQGRRLFEQERDREAIIEVKRSIFLSPYQAEAHLILGRIYLRGGRLNQARDAFKISVWSDETVSGLVALGEAYLLAERREEARAAAERALVLDPAAPAARRLLERATAPGSR